MRLLGLRKSRAENKNKHVPVPLCADPCGDYLLRAGGYCKLLQEVGQWQPDAVEAAKTLLRNEMAYVPAGSAELQNFAATDDDDEVIGSLIVEERDFFVDRCAVTNVQFKRFVDADAYRDASLWPVEIQPFVFQFVDRTDLPGPAHWENGCYLPEKRDHPVVGLSWHEANAYANWLGKALPTSCQWQRAACWWNPESRYPWGSSFSDERANIYSAGFADTVPVSSYAESATPNGILQLVGNVWEWVNTSVSSLELNGKLRPIGSLLGEIRGGAYDTYFASQASCRFRSGQPLLARRHNVGFRCIAPSELLAQSNSG